MTGPGRRLTPLIGLVAAGATALALVVSHAGPASATATRALLPRVPVQLYAPVSELRIKPSSIIYTGDGTGIVAGRIVHGVAARLHWSSWTAASAAGTGDNNINNCAPDCASGRFTSYPVSIEAWRPGILHGQRVFTRLTIRYTHGRPPGSAAHFTFTDVYRGGWSFGPPSADGYCTRTAGTPKAPGCSNITALPPKTPLGVQRSAAGQASR